MTRRVLVVEDRPANAKLVRGILERAGFAVLAAGDGAAGLALARRELPDVILMDVQLPGSDGFTTVRHLKEDAATRAIPVIAVTARALCGDEERARAAGCDGYVAKPIRYRHLLAAIDAVMEKAR